MKWQDNLKHSCSLDTLYMKEGRRVSRSRDNLLKEETNIRGLSSSLFSSDAVTLKKNALFAVFYARPLRILEALATKKIKTVLCKR